MKNKDISRKMTAEEIGKLAQRLYDKKNWYGLNGEESVKLIACRLNYLEITGKELQLEYNCPA